MSSQSDIRDFATIEDLDSVEVITLPDVTKMTEEDWNALFRSTDNTTFDVVLIDLESTSYLPARVMQKLLQFNRDRKNKEYQLALCGFNQMTLNVISIVKLDQFYSVFGTRTQALTHFLG